MISEQPYRNVGQNERRLSLLGGGATLLVALRRGGVAGALLGGLGAALLYRGSTGHCAVNAAMGRNSAGEEAAGGAIHLHAAVTVDRGAEELYAFWRDFANLPRFMRHLREVRVLEGGRSYWVADLPRGRTLEWESEITVDSPGERIVWHSLEGAEVANQGEVRFAPAPGGRGTEVHLEMVYEPPGGVAARTLGRALGALTEGMIRQDLRRLKQVMESGEASTAAIVRPAD